MACNFFDLACQVFMDRVSTHQKPYRRVIMESYGASVTNSPSERTACDRQVQAEDPDSPGALGIAISEAVEAAVTSQGKRKYSLGSILGHVMMPPDSHRIGEASVV
ncbi:MAG: hypothetical protein MUO23_04430 [Anaerolineales bacterium]|nr:hypothetical protein [Anaerolineales bacterium]